MPRPAPVSASAKGDASTEAIRVVRAKIDAHLYDQALADLKGMLEHDSTSANAAGAYLLVGTIYERQQRPQDAMATYVELKTKFRASPSAAEATYRLGELTMASKRDDRERAAIALFDEGRDTRAEKSVGTALDRSEGGARGTREDARHRSAARRVSSCRAGVVSNNR